MALKQQVLPDNLKELETALKGIGIDAERDLDQLNFASFRTEKKGIQTIGVAACSFSAKAVLMTMKLKKMATTIYGPINIFPIVTDLSKTFMSTTSISVLTPPSTLTQPSHPHTP